MKKAPTGLDLEAETPRASVVVLCFQFVHFSGMFFQVLSRAASPASPLVSVPALGQAGFIKSMCMAAAVLADVPATQTTRASAN